MVLLWREINYTYDARNQLIDFNGQQTYAYDHDGRRIQSTVGVTTTDYLWDEFSRYGDVVLETGANTVSYTLANGMVLSQTNNGTTQYLLPDAQNSTRAVTNAAGNITSNYDYDAFGNLLGEPTLETNYLYTGQQFDAVSGLYSLRARYYDPSLGRFLSRDTWAYNYQDPFELNRYVYAANNPATMYDPSGYTSLFSYVKSTVTSGAFVSGVAHGLANVFIEYLFGMMFVGEYNLWSTQTLVTFGEGFIGGAISHKVGAFVVAGKLLSKLVMLLTDVVIGTTGDVLIRGDSLGKALPFNIAASIFGEGFETVGRKAAPRIVEKLPWMKRFFGDTDPNAPNNRGGGNNQQSGGGVNINTLPKPTVKNADLQDMIDSDYGISVTQGQRVGNGSTADAVIHTHNTGNLVGGSDHIDKAVDLRRRYSKWIKRQRSAYQYYPANAASAADIQTAIDLHNQLANALKLAVPSGTWPIEPPL